jgi:23S rRNA (uracil1939-C5)-methyltransferase
MANYFKAVVKPQASNQRLTVTVDKLDMNGAGVSRWQNKPVFIAGSLPHEVAEIKIIEQKNKYVRAKLISISNPSDSRVTPQCQHFGHCGGCDLQILNMSAQLAFKQSKVSELFSRCFSDQNIVKNLGEKDLPWHAAIESSPWHYRRKARIGVQFDKKSQATIGFRQKSTNQLVAIKSCPVLVEPLNAIFPLLKKLLVKLTVKSAIGHIEVIQADVIDSHLKNKSQKYNQVVLVVRQMRIMNITDIKLWQSYAQKNDWYVIIDDGDKQEPLDSLKGISSPVLSYELVDNSKIHFSSSDFIQINHEVNNAMISQALAWLNVLPSDNVLDLFCGLGNFSLALAKHAKHVVGVEGVQAMVDKATHNAKINSFDNCQFYQEDLNSHWLLASWAKTQDFDKVLLDPARAGAEEAVNQIAELKIPSILYVSCDPATLARDSVILVSKGYQLEKISVIDMFAQTKHVETMVLFTR